MRTSPKLALYLWKYRSIVIALFMLTTIAISIIYVFELSASFITSIVKSKPRFTHIAVIVDDQVDVALLHSVLNVMKNIPPDWPIQIITLEKYRNFLENSSLKDYFKNGKIFMTALNFRERNSSTSADEYSNSILVSTQFWRQVDGEKVLLFQTDSTFCSNSSLKITDFLEYDFIGAPWSEGSCCNGGFSLRSRRKILQVLSRATYPKNINEDVWYSYQLALINASIAPLKVARMFSVKSVYYSHPLAVHKPLIEYLGIENMRRICSECVESQLTIPYCFR